jgi:hypothetical protein
VRVAGEERVAGGRAGRRHRPVVARQRRLVLGGEARGARREERARGRRGAGGERVGRAGRRQPERVDARRALPVGLDGLDDGLRHREERGRGGGAHPRGRRGAVVLAREQGERVAHPVHQVHAVGGLPAHRPGARELVLDRERRRAQRAGVGVDARRVRVEHAAAGRVHDGELGLGGAREAEPPRLLVERKRGGPGELGHAPARGERAQVQLEQPVARHHVAEGAVGVLLARGEDVGHAASVVRHAHGAAQAGHGDRVGRGRGARAGPHAVRGVEQGPERRQRPHRPRRRDGRGGEHQRGRDRARPPGAATRRAARTAPPAGGTPAGPGNA